MNGKQGAITIPLLQKSTGQPPMIKSTTWIVLAAFERGENCDLFPAFEAQQMPSEHAAVARAKLMSRSYAGVIAWKRPAKPDEASSGNRRSCRSMAMCRTWNRL